MKKILKKLGVLGLLVAIVSPFINVNAETNANGCEPHLQNYFFLDQFNPYDLFANTDGNGKYTDERVNYTKFPYIFSGNENTIVKVSGVSTNYLDSDDKVANYIKYYKEALNGSSGKLYWNSTSKDGTIFVDNKNYSDYTTNTLVLHGVWATGENSDKLEAPKWPQFDVNETIQDALNYENINHVEIEPARYTTQTNYSSYFSSNGSSETNMADYFEKLEKGTYENGAVYANSYIALKITRELKENNLKDDNLIFGYELNDAYYVFTTKATSENTDSEISYDEVKDNSYEGYKKFIEAYIDNDDDVDRFNPNQANTKGYVMRFDANKDKINIYADTTYYWPVMLNVEYEVCPLTDDGGDNGDTPTPISYWMVTYEDNAKGDTSVTNMPSSSEKTKVGTNIKVDDKKPTRDNYTFKGWCETDNCSNPYQPGDEIKSPESSTTVKLLAQWAKVGPEDNKKTGVMSYVIGFMSVGVVAGGVYLISKKKNLFKQI